MSYLNDYLLEAQIEDAYETGFLDALEKVAAKEEKEGHGLRNAALGAGAGLMALHGKNIADEYKNLSAYDKAMSAKQLLNGGPAVDFDTYNTVGEKLKRAGRAAYGSTKQVASDALQATKAHMGRNKAAYAAGIGAAGLYGLGRAKEAMDKKAAYEEYILDKIAADKTIGDRAKEVWEKTKGYGKSAYEHVGRNKLKYGAGAGVAALGGGAYAYKKHQEKKAAFEAALAYLEDYDY